MPLKLDTLQGTLDLMVLRTFSTLLAQDLRYAVRVLWKTPAFTAIVTLSLALGIGANTALFSLVDDLLLRSLPVRAPERLVQVRQTVMGPGFKKTGASLPPAAFDYVRAHNHVLSEIVGFNQLTYPVVAVDGALEPPRLVEHVSDNFFRDLGVTPSLGRTPGPSDDAVAIINDRVWRTRFGRSASVLGRALTVDGLPYTIVGVAPPRFIGMRIEQSVDIWISSRVVASQQMIARLKPGVTPEQAQASLQVLFSQLGQAQPDVVSWDDRSAIELLPAGKGLSQLRAEYERPLLALTVLVTLVLLITCTNVGNLVVVRNSARRRELTMRVALGARRTRLMTQCLVESLVLAAMGGILALVVARWGVSIILSMLPLPAIPESLAFTADARVLGFAAGVSLLGALLFGLAPAWRATQVDLTAVLRSSQGNTPTKGARRLGRLLVAGQVGLSVLLLVGAGLFVQTLRNLVNRDIGFNPESLLQVSLDTRGSGYQRGQVGPLYRLLVERVAAIPGVRSVAGIRNPVMAGARSRCGVQLPGVALASDETVECADVGPSFFETMNIPLVSGRTFTTADFEQARRFMVINEAFARRFFPNEDPSGRLPIIGVVRNSRLGAVRGEIGPMMYLMLPREPDRFSALQVRSVGDPEAVAQAVQAEIRRVNPRLLTGVRTMRQEIEPRALDRTYRRGDQRILRGAGIAARLNRDLRRGFLHRVAEDQRARHPHGAGRRPMDGDPRVAAGHDAGVRRRAGGRGHRRCGRRPDDRERHRRLAVRAHRDGCGKHRHRSARDDRRGAGRLHPAGAPRDANRPAGGHSARVTEGGEA